MGDREFRTEESYKAERETREMILPFLLSRGFRDLRDERKAIGKSESQTIHATAPGGERLAMRVKLCWRRVHDEETYSAVQLLAKVKNRDDWEGSLQQLVERARRGGAGVS